MGWKRRLARWMAWRWRTLRAVLIATLVLVPLASLVGYAAPAASPSGIAAGLSALITLNAVVLALVYATTQRAVILSLRSEAARGFLELTIYMSSMSITGVVLGVVYLVWEPDGLLPFTAAFLIVAPGLIPFVAIQELLARRAGSAQAVAKLLGRHTPPQAGEDPDRSGVGRLQVRAKEFEADPQDPFAADVLDRRRIVEAVCRIVADIGSPAVISVDGGWGSGKTAFGRMCAALLRSESFQGRVGAVVEFNAWTQNHAGDPQQDLVSALTQQINGDDDLRRRLTEALEDQAVKAATEGAIDAVLLASHDAGAEASGFKDLLAAFVASSRGHVVVFVDELDRCRPDHALRVLETARNLLDVAGVIVVATVNLEAVQHAVASLLGPECDTDTYLRRFIDLRVALPPLESGDLQRFLTHALEQTGLADRLGGRNSRMRCILGALAAVHPRSLRDLQQAVHRAVVLLASVEPASDDDAALAHFRQQTALTLLVLREADRSAYEDFVHGHRDGCDAANALASAIPEGPPGSGMIEPESVQGPPAVPAEQMHWMEALLLAVTRDGLPPAPQQDLYPRYSGYGRDDAWPSVQHALAMIRQQIKGHELDLQELADLVELASYEPRTALAPLGSDRAAVG